jgi:hypothetical protein
LVPEKLGGEAVLEVGKGVGSLVIGAGVALVGAGVGEGIGGDISIGFPYINVALSLHMLLLSPSAVTVAEALIINSEQHSATNGFAVTTVSPSSRRDADGSTPAIRLSSYDRCHTSCPERCKAHQRKRTFVLVPQYSTRSYSSVLVPVFHFCSGLTTGNQPLQNATIFFEQYEYS